MKRRTRKRKQIEMPVRALGEILTVLQNLKVDDAKKVLRSAMAMLPLDDDGSESLSEDSHRIGFDPDPIEVDIDDSDDEDTPEETETEFPEETKITGRRA